MRKIRFIVGELFRSFRKGLFKNILLMIMFSISLVMTVLMSSYYLDIGDRIARLDGTDGDTLWCNLDYMTTGDDFTGIFNTVTGCRNMMDYYDEIHSSKENPTISMEVQQPLTVNKDDMENLLGSSGYTGPDEFPVYFDSYGDSDVISTYGIYNLKSVQLDLGAWKMFGLRTQEGEGFTEQNMTISDISAPIPIILGSDYNGIIEIGTEMNVEYWEYNYRCRVIGILEDGAMTPEIKFSGAGYRDSCLLDKYIIFPLGIKVAADTDTVDEIEKYANMAYMSFQVGIALVKDGQLNDYIDMLREKAEKYGVTPVHLEGGSLGADVFRKESAEGVKIMLILTVILLCFTFYGIGIVFYDKIRANKRVYGIYLMNGCSISMILIPYLIEIALILIPSIFVCRYIFIDVGRWAFRERVILNYIYIFTLAVFAAGSVLIMLLMRGVDTEHLIRQKD